MKNLFKGFVVAAIAIAAMACTPEEPTNPGALSTPEFAVTINENTIAVNWSTVDGAAYYEIWLNEDEHVKTDKTIHLFEGLKWDTEYTVNLQAISTDASKNSKIGSKKVTIDERKVPSYREWCPMNGSTATAISDNGRWVVGCFDRQGMIINLNTDELTMIENFDCMDVSDEGVIAGATYENSQGGEAALYIDGKIHKLDLSELTTSDMSSLTAITPDGMYVVGWWWEYDEKSYYGGIYGSIVPFAYDLLKDRITVLECGDNIYPLGGVNPCGVSPDREIVGAEQSAVMMAVYWKDEYTSFTYPVFEYDSEYVPTLTFGDTQTRMTPNGTYIYSVAKTYPEDGGEVAQPACYNVKTGELTTFEGKCVIGSVTAMTDDGIAFLNDVPYYMGTTSYVVDVVNNPETQTPIVTWLLEEHDLNLYSYIHEGVITIGASADGTKLLGIVNTDMGWVTYVIALDGEPMPEI